MCIGQLYGALDMMFLKQMLKTQQDLQTCWSARDIRINADENLAKLYVMTSENTTLTLRCCMVQTSLRS